MHSMPTPAIVSAIVSSVIGAVADSPSEPPQPAPFAAMLRSFPAESRKGELVPPAQGELEISGNRMAAAPGLQIRNQQNLIVMPSTLQETVPVRYQLDPMGKVWRIWILSAAEQAASDPKQ